MRTLFQNLPLFVILFVIVSIVRAVMAAAKAKQGARPAAGAPDTEDQRRVREIQERIRRIAAERRGQPPPLQSEPAPPPFPMPAVPSIDTFGGPARRIARFERRIQPTPVPPPAADRTRNAELERQEQLREDARVLEEKRTLTARHEAYAAGARTAAAQSESGLRATARDRLLEDVRDPQSVRRAFVLREVLGPPVGMR